MKCDEVIRELAVPSDDQDPAALAEHLAGCRACALWARHTSQFDRLWEATRPADPTPEAWEAVWVRINESLDASTRMRNQASASSALYNGSSPKVAASNTPQPFRSTRPRLWSFAAVTSFGLAQAAAVLFAVAIVWQSFHSPQTTQFAKHPTLATDMVSSSTKNASPVAIEIEEGSLVVIRADGEEPEVLVRTSESSPFGIDDWLLMFNTVESMAPNPVVAMKE
jgi:hypothetical protein